MKTGKYIPEKSLHPHPLALFGDTDLIS